MGTPGVVISPWFWSAGDYQGKQITITVTFNNTTKAIISASVFRDPACMYTKIYIGLPSAVIPISVPSGTSAATGSQLALIGLNTINDILALQITAGP